ncbi:GNAT family N-acetyltransferase [Devosia sp.]|uniref:GNAT family N-acetyltransferase n=1 Tax=Devosia sp. TaxID=1871048 RepID=UPI003BAA7F06
MSDVTIRPLAPSDSITELTDLLHRAYAPLAAMGLRFWATHQSEDDTRHRISQGTCLVAVMDDTICGTILFKNAGQTQGCPWYDLADIASIAQFAVEPRLQSKGLGAQLMARAENLAIAAGARELALDTAEPATHLVAWYTRLGYRFIEHAQWLHTNYRNVVLSKRLALP